MVYDLSNIEYDHSQALKSMNELNKRLQTSPEAIEVEEIDQSNYRPQFTSKRMKLENVKASPAKKYMPTIEYDD